MVLKILIESTSYKLNRVYDYYIEDEEGLLGKRVLINFGMGKGRNIEGVIVKVIEDENYTKDISKLKRVIEVLDQESYIDENKLKLAKWISKMYFCNVYDALKLMFPKDTNKKLKKKELTPNQITMLKLAMSQEEIEKNIEENKIKSSRHIKILRKLEEFGTLSMEEAVSNLGVSYGVIKTIEKNGYISIYKVDEKKIEENIAKDTKLTPTAEQEKVIKGIISKMGKYNVSLIHGITGSGKTEVYLQIIEEYINANKTAIVLVPEISLTTQTRRRFVSRFGDVVSVLHSKMTAGEKKKEYIRILKGEVKIVIGPRSALFVPLKNLGLIIMDEEHDSSYVSFSNPRYNTREVANYIAHETQANLILGSATPDVTTMYKAQEGIIDYYRLNKRPGKSMPPEVKIVDMKEDALTNTSKILSLDLKEEISKNLSLNEQTFIFLNRRGYSSYIVCRTCGKALRCPNCDVNLTYHKKSGLLLCHYCSYCETLKNACPMCGAETLEEAGIGTEKVEQEIKNTFPGITTLRMDMDTTVKKGSHEMLLDKFKKENISVLVGTQMISKGHDIENVTLVGVINADLSMGDDYLTAEKAFSNLLQVAGRAGRGSKPGRVILQAIDTNSYILDAVKNNSYDEFYEKEIEFRKVLNYPPFMDLILMEIVSTDKEKLKKDSEKLYNIFSEDTKQMYKVYSPKAPFIGRIGGKYRIQMIIKAKVDNKVLDLLYEKLDKYDKIKDRNIKLTVAKNPVKV